MASRLQTSGAPLVETGIQTPGVAVVAQPVDTFVRPVVDSQAAQLAQALSRFAPSLGALGDTLQVKENQSQLEAGRNTASELHRLGKDYATEVKAGRIQPNNSPFFMAGLRETQGQNLADDFGQDLLAEYSKQMKDGALSTSSDMADFRKFATDFSSQWQQAHNLTGSDQRTLTGFSSKADTWISAIGREFAAGLGSRTSSQMVDSIYTQMRTHVMTELRRGTSLEAIAKDFQSNFNFWSGLGAKGRIINQTQYNALSSAIDELSNSASDSDRAAAGQAMALMHLVPGGSPGSGGLADQPWAKDSWSQLQGRVSDNIRQGEAASAARHRAEVDGQVSTIRSDMISAMLENKYTPVSQFIARANAIPGVSPSDVSALYSLHNDALNEDTQSNVQLHEHVFQAIWNGGNITESQIANLVGPGRLTLADAQDLIAQLRSAKQARTEKSPLNDTTLTRLLGQLPAIFTQTLPGAGGGFFTVENGNAVNAVSATISAEYVQARQRGEISEDPVKQSDWLQRRLEQLKPIYQGPYAKSFVNPTGTIPPARIAGDEWKNTAVINSDELKQIEAARRNPALWESPAYNALTNKLEHFWGIDGQASMELFYNTQKALLTPPAQGTSTTP